MKKRLEKFFKGYCVLAEVDSPINGRVRVWEDFFGKKRLVVGGLSQSGSTVEKLWKKIFLGFRISSFAKASKDKQDLGFRRVLVLGLGGGSVCKLINHLFPKTQITAVEIDPVMIDLGKRYFGLDEIKNLEIEIGDATKFLNHKSSIMNQGYNLILVDLYLGHQVPPGVEDGHFLENLKGKVSDGGVILINRLYYGEKIKETDIFAQKLTQFFGKIEAKLWGGNKLFLCQK